MTKTAQNSNVPEYQDKQGQFIVIQGASNNMRGQSSTPMISCTLITAE